MLHGTTCYVNFSCNNVAQKIEHRCEFLNQNQELWTRCLVQACAKNRPRHHMTRCSRHWKFSSATPPFVPHQFQLVLYMIWVHCYRVEGWVHWFPGGSQDSRSWRGEWKRFETYFHVLSPVHSSLSNAICVTIPAIIMVISLHEPSRDQLRQINCDFLSISLSWKVYFFLFNIFTKPEKVGVVTLRRSFLFNYIIFYFPL